MNSGFLVVFFQSFLIVLLSFISSTLFVKQNPQIYSSFVVVRLNFENLLIEFLSLLLFSSFFTNHCQIKKSSCIFFFIVGYLQKVSCFFIILFKFIIEYSNIKIGFKIFRIDLEKINWEKILQGLFYKGLALSQK